MSERPRLRRILLPIAVFTGVVAVHFAYKGLFPEKNPAQSRWLAVATDRSWMQSYIASGSYWLGYSYALSLAFASVAFRRFRERRVSTARTLAIGGVTLTGILAFAGCFLIGCCGSPMLAVYLSLFGAAFLPFAKPLVAGLTTVSLVGGWWWMTRRAGRPAGASTVAAGTCGCADSGCDPMPRQEVAGTQPAGKRG